MVQCTANQRRHWGCHSEVFLNTMALGGVCFYWAIRVVPCTPSACLPLALCSCVHPEASGSVWKASGSVWKRLEASGSVWKDVHISRKRLEASGSVWKRLEASGRRLEGASGRCVWKASGRCVWRVRLERSGQKICILEFLLPMTIFLSAHKLARRIFLPHVYFCGLGRFLSHEILYQM